MKTLANHPFKILDNAELQLVSGGNSDDVTSYAVGEEGGEMTTMSVGETGESGNPGNGGHGGNGRGKPEPVYTTMMVGEEGGEG